MGVFYYVEAVALAEDIPEIEEYHSLEDFYSKMSNGYQQVWSKDTPKDFSVSVS